MLSRRQRNSSPSIMLAPLVDLIFTLLIFFMLVSTYITPSIKVELPKSTSLEKAEKRAVTITITWEGAMYLEGRKVSFGELAQRLKGLDPQRFIGVRIRADKKVPIEKVVSVIDLVRASPVKSVDLEVTSK